MPVFYKNTKYGMGTLDFTDRNFTQITSSKMTSSKLLVVILPAMVKSHFRVCIVLIVARSHSRLY